MLPCHHLNRTTFSGYSLCKLAYQTSTKTRDDFTTTNILRKLIKSNKDIVNDYQDILNR
jgi:hypothetical protein